MMTFFIYAITAVLVICCLLLIGVVLLQRPRSEGLGSAFGGGMTESMFGAGTTDVLTKFTIWMAAAFFVCTLLLAVLMSHRDSDKSSSLDHLTETPAIEESAVQLPAESPEEATAPEETPAPAEDSASPEEKAE